MIRWEYWIDTLSEMSTDALVRHLDIVGKEGWEVFHLVEDDLGGRSRVSDYKLYMKRQISEPDA